jgi:hypothetical protein
MRTRYVVVGFAVALTMALCAQAVGGGSSPRKVAKQVKKLKREVRALREDSIHSLVSRTQGLSVEANGATNSGTARCQTGERAVSGGVTGVSGQYVPGDVKLVDTRPDPPGTTPTGWFVRVGNGDADPSEHTIWVICASP